MRNNLINNYFKKLVKVLRLLQWATHVHVHTYVVIHVIVARVAFTIETRVFTGEYTTCKTHTKPRPYPH